ncbi:HAD-like domain-containing protein [Microdochium trichocladiopsis]|uniref:HAD-like domain-containing protein n=1 Tax=Microdochium trichocladiopsis TaxID=1682393 RepID=A0A9P8XVU5_9PEZI|nr:HAD-like domain-containing protein [Microdochium trichocladiopsis]KAH7020871.1 HAD-like domain-containing protein [Microdochium trichocladiopsis]
MDGLLINTEDIITACINHALAKHGRPPIPPNLRAQIMGVPNSTSGDVYNNWAQLPVPREQHTREVRAEMRRRFPDCRPLPGAEDLLFNLSRAAHVATSGRPIRLALASGTKTEAYKLKMSSPETRTLLETIHEHARVLGDDPRLQPGRDKPAPDIYRLALRDLNSCAVADGEDPILPGECLVFEDSVIGVEAARRAGMRVVWVPHPDVLSEYAGREGDVIAGRTNSLAEHVLADGDNGSVGEYNDGWGECIESLAAFEYHKYGIDIGVPHFAIPETQVNSLSTRRLLHVR